MLNECLMIKNLATFVYNDFTKEETKDNEKLFLKWYEDLGIMEEEINKAMCNIYIVTNVPKFQNFQYRLLHRAIVTNIELYRWKIINSDLCSLCNEEQETLEHLLIKCKEVKPLWEYIKEYAIKYTNNVCLTSKNIMLNNVTDSWKSVVNFLVLVCKQYIYRQ